MTAKEKAKELFDKYWSLEWQLYTNVKSIKRIGMTKDAAKQCAKIAAKEVFCIDINAKTESQRIIEERIENYWNEVLKEIELL